jgi:acetyl-CoA C-acetyltransferase
MSWRSSHTGARSQRSATAASRARSSLFRSTAPGRSRPTSIRAPTPRPRRWRRCARCSRHRIRGPTVTAGNSSGQNDGAAACLVTHPERAHELGLRPLARLVSWAVAGVEPETMGIGPVPATERALERAGLTLDDIGLIELNEAFAAQVLAVLREWSLPDGLDRVNVNGSGISLGHPVGATGARILATLLHELRRRNARFGLETMCIGGGQGLAAVFEALSPADA